MQAASILSLPAAYNKMRKITQTNRNYVSIKSLSIIPFCSFTNQNYLIIAFHYYYYYYQSCCCYRLKLNGIQQYYFVQANGNLFFSLA